MVLTKTSLPVLFLLLVAAVAVLYLPPVFTAVPNPPLNEHAVTRHPGLAEKIHQCLNENGPEMVYQDKQTGRRYLCTKLPDGKWAFKIIQRINGEWQTITAYYKGDGSLKTLVDYFWRNGITKVTH